MLLTFNFSYYSLSSVCKSSFFFSILHDLKDKFLILPEILDIFMIAVILEDELRIADLTHYRPAIPFGKNI